MIKYPDGRQYKPLQTTHPNSIGNTTKTTKDAPNASKTSKKRTNHANRGMTLEKDITDSNLYYLTNDIAVIHKKPTPIQIVNVDYKNNSQVITEAYFRQHSELDFIGIYKTRYVDFDAKETQSATAFPLSNFHEHQVKHMIAVSNQGAICFAIIRFTKLNETYLLDAEHIISYWNNQSTGGRKSIPYEYIYTNGHFIKEGYTLRLDYIAIIQQHYF